MLRVDKLQLDLVINGDESRKRLSELGTQAAELRKEMKKIKDQELLGTKQQELGKIETEMENIRHTIGITGLSMKELAERSKTLKAALIHMAPESQQFAEYKKELEEVNTRHAELKKGAQIAGKGVQESMSGFSLAGMVAGGMAAYEGITGMLSGIGSFVMSSVEAFREEERAIQKVEQAIKQTGGTAGLSLQQLTDEADRLQNTTIFAGEDILNSATAQLLTFSNIAGDTFLKAQVAAMDLSTVLDGDLQAASIQVGKALNDPVAGLTALRKVGVSFTDDQRKMINGLVETNRLEEAQGVILQELNRQYGGQAEAAAKGSGAMKQAANQIGEIVETIGGFIAKLITPVIVLFSKYATSLNELITPSKTAVETFQEHGRSVAVLVKDIDPLIDRYDQLKSKTNLNATEQSELKKIIGQVSAVMPGAATAFDKYGNAIEISSQRVRDYIKGQVQLLRHENRKAIDETISDLADVNLAIGQSKPKMDEVAKTGTFTVKEQAGQNYSTRKANPAEIADIQRQYQEMANTQIALNTKLSQLRGDALQQSLNSYKGEKDAAADAAKATVDIKRISMEELKAMEEDGGDTQKKSAKEEIKRRDDLKKNAEDYARYMKKITDDLENARVQSIKDAREKELKMEELSYKKKLSEIKGNTDLEIQLKKALETEYQTNITSIRDKYDNQEKEKSFQLEKKKWEMKLKGLVDGSIEWFDVSQQLLAAQREAELSNAELTETQRMDIEEKYKEMRANLNTKPDDSKSQANLDSRLTAEWEAEKMMLERTGQMTISKKKEIAEQERDIALAAAEGNTEQQTLIWEQYYAKLKELNMEWVTDAVSGLTSLVNSFSSFDQALSGYEQAQLQRDEAQNNAQKDNQKRRLDAGLINQKQYDANIAKLDEDMAAKKRKIARDEAIRQKAISLVQAIINTAQAITAALTVPYVGIALAVVAGIMGAAQVALIAATPVPEAARGRYDVIGQDDKKRYRSVPYQDSFFGIPGSPLLINETGDEIVIDPETTKRLKRSAPGILDAINQARTSEPTGRVILPRSPANNMNFRSDIPDMLMRSPQRMPGSAREQNATADSPPVIVNTDNSGLLDVIDRLNSNLEKGIRSTINYDHLEKELQMVDDIIADSSK